MKKIVLLLLCYSIALFALAVTKAAAKDISFEERMARQRALIAAASTCKERPKTDDELFALAMQDYWRSEMQNLWQQDAKLNQYYLGAQGRIDVTDKDCGLIRDRTGNPQRIGRDTCYPWKLEEYDTLDKLAERLKLVPEFGAKRSFDQPSRREGGWIYDEIVRDLLHGKVYRPEGDPLYLPEHNRHAGFAVLHKRGNAVRWYGPDCCALLRGAEWAKEHSQRRDFSKNEAVRADACLPEGLPNGLTYRDLRRLRVTYRDVDFNLFSGQGGVRVWTQGKVDDYDLYLTHYYVVSPCGTIIPLKEVYK